MIPSDSQILDAIQRESQKVCAQLLSASKRAELLPGLQNDVFLSVRLRMATNPQFSDAEGLERFVRTSLQNRIYALLKDPFHARQVELPDEAHLPSDVSTHASLDIGVPGEVVGEVCRRLARRVRTPGLMRRKADALRVLDLFMRGLPVPTGVRAETWFSRGRRTLRRVAEQVVRDLHGEAALMRLRRATASARKLMEGAATNSGDSDQGPAVDRLTRVAEAVALFREQRGAREYRERLELLSETAIGLLQQLVDGASRNDLLAMLAERLLVDPAKICTEHARASDASATLENELANIETAFCS